MTRKPTVNVTLLQRFFDGFQSLCESKNESQAVLSLCPWSIQTYLESGEIFLIALPWHDKIDELLEHQEKLLRACRLMSLDGMNIFSSDESSMNTHYKLLRVS